MSIGETDGNEDSGEENISEVLANAKSSDTREGFVGHTKTPWGFAGDDGEHRTARIYQGAKCEGKLIAVVANGEPWIHALDGWEADAAFIVRAVNSHDDLLAALKEIVQRNEIQHWFNLDQARAAILKAESQS